MSLSSLNDIEDSPAESRQSPLQFPLVPTSPATRKLTRSLPPDILIRIFQRLPISTLVNVALVSRRFKVLVYDDEIWDDKLRHVLSHQHAGQHVSTLLSTSNVNNSLVDHGQAFYINNKPLHELIPGLTTDPFSARARAKSTGQAREQFKLLYTQLKPYYIDLRHHRGESMVLQEFGTRPVDCGKILNLLTGLGDCHVTDDWQVINERLTAICQYFESASHREFELAYNTHNLSDMKDFAHAMVALNGGTLCMQTFIQMHPIFFDNPMKPEENFVASRSDLEPFQKFISIIQDELKQQSEIIASVFPDPADLFYTLADRIFEDVITEYLNQLLARAQDKSQRLYLHTMSVVLKYMIQLAEMLVSEDLPAHIDAERSINLLHKILLPFMDDYLEEEGNYIEEAYQKELDAWDSRPGSDRNGSPERLSHQTRETFKRNYLSTFKKVITVPIDIVSSAATTIASPFQRAKSDDDIRSDTSSSVNNNSRKSIASVADSPQATPPATPIIAPHPMSRSSGEKFSESALVNVGNQLDSMQDLLSLEMALHFIHMNKDTECRIQQFMRVGFPGRMKNDIYQTYEHIFVQLLKFLGPMHIEPAFSKANERLAIYKPSAETTELSTDNVPPLTEFFEMVHVGDVIQQMIQLYYDEDITKFVDRQDFLSEINKGKKDFEKLLDDSVAKGMDRGIEVLLGQVEFILAKEQTPQDFNPDENAVVELRPTKACLDTIQCLKTNTSMLRGAAEKSTMDLFFSEIGKRFFESLCKHLRHQKVNEHGGFRYISDMNAYYDFICTLRQSSVTPYFTALKSLANIYIISSATDIKNVIHDLERYQGLIRIEDLFEFAACRTDWPLIRKAVQKDMTDCNVM